MNSVDDNIKSLTSNDIYSLILFALYKLKDVPEYSTLSSLAYVLDKENLEKFLKYFGGMTITIPHMRDLKLAANCLLLYQMVNIEGNDFSKSLASLNIGNDYNLIEIKKMYFALCKVIADYNFKI